MAPVQLVKFLASRLLSVKICSWYIVADGSPLDFSQLHCTCDSTGSTNHVATDCYIHFHQAMCDSGQTQLCDCQFISYCARSMHSVDVLRDWAGVLHFTVSVGIRVLDKSY